MFDINPLPISGDIVVAGIAWAALSGFVLGPVVAERTIANSDWHQTCEQDLRANVEAQIPQTEVKPDISCNQLMGAIGNGADELCNHGGDLLFDLLSIDPLAGQKEQARRLETERLSRIAELTPSRCSCAAAVVGADRLTWGLHAGSARLAGGPQDLSADLTKALHSPACAMRVEG